MLTIQNNCDQNFYQIQDICNFLSSSAMSVNISVYFKILIIYSKCNLIKPNYIGKNIPFTAFERLDYSCMKQIKHLIC